MSGGHLKTFDWFVARVEIIGDVCCWKLPIKIDCSTGYVRIRYQFKQMHAHRAFYSELIGYIPQGLQIDHLCRNRWCCNPGHLTCVTPKINSQRGKAGWHWREKRSLQNLVKNAAIERGAKDHAS